MKNSVTLIGRVGKDPEIKDIGNGNQVANFSLATSEKYTNKQGEKIEETQWHNLVFFGKICFVIQSYVNKGDLLSVDGKIRYESSEVNGEKKYYTKIICDNMVMLGSKSDQSSDQGNKPQSNSFEAPKVSNSVIDNSEDLPF